MSKSVKFNKDEYQSYGYGSKHDKSVKKALAKIVNIRRCERKGKRMNRIQEQE
jgi:hypothetical protein